MTTFNIQSQHAEVVNNVGGDMIVGGIAVGWRPEAVRADLARLAQELELLELPRERRVEARQLLAEAASQSRDGGDPRQVASRLQSLTRVLAQAGGVAKAGVGAVEALTRAAVALGPAGKALTALLAAL